MSDVIQNRSEFATKTLAIRHPDRYFEAKLGKVNMVSKTDVLESLKKVIDPEIGINIVDVGLIYRVDVREDEVEIDFTLTAPGCPLGDTINNDIITVVREDTNINNVITNLVWNPPWSVEFLSEEARLDLGYPI